MKFCKSPSFLIFQWLVLFQVCLGIANSSSEWNTSHSISGDLEEEIIRSKQELQNERSNRVAALCQAKKYQEAEMVFTQLNNFSFIYPIMESLYGDPYHEYLAGFTQALHALPDRIAAYQIWMELLEQNGGMLNGGILVFAKTIQDEVDNVVGQPPEELLNLHARLDIYADTVVNIWSLEVRLGEFSNAKEFGSPPTYHMIGDIFKESISKLVKKILENEEREYFTRALEFAVNLRWNIHRYTALKAIYDHVNTQDRRLVVAFKIRETMNGCFVGPDPAEPVQELFRNLKENLPSNVQQLLWHERCDIKNTYYSGEYLYGDIENFDVNNKRMFTWIPKTAKDGSAFMLEARINATGDGLEFRIESKYWTDYKYFDVHTTGAGDGAIKKYVSLRKTSPSAYNWKVELDGLGEDLLLFYMPLSSYLMADIIQYDSNRRNAILWVTTALDPTTHRWALDCVPV